MAQSKWPSWKSEQNMMQSNRSFVLIWVVNLDSSVEAICIEWGKNIGGFLNESMPSSILGIDRTRAHRSHTAINNQFQSVVKRPWISIGANPLEEPYPVWAQFIYSIPYISSISIFYHSHVLWCCAELWRVCELSLVWYLLDAVFAKLKQTGSLSYVESNSFIIVKNWSRWAKKLGSILIPSF